MGNIAREKFCFTYSLLAKVQRICYDTNGKHIAIPINRGCTGFDGDRWCAISEPCTHLAR